MTTAIGSDCRKIDVDVTYKLKFSESAEGFSALLSDIKVIFNYCQGIYNTNNDFASSILWP